MIKRSSSDELLSRAFAQYQSKTSQCSSAIRNSDRWKEFNRIFPPNFRIYSFVQSMVNTPPTLPKTPFSWPPLSTRWCTYSLAYINSRSCTRDRFQRSNWASVMGCSRRTQPLWLHFCWAKLLVPHTVHWTLSILPPDGAPLAASRSPWGSW